MPQPPLLPPLDWQNIFDHGLEFGDWLEAGEHPRHGEAMLRDISDLELSPQQAGFLSALPKTVHVVAIAEDWCGDVVRHVPVLQCLADAAKHHLLVRYIDRAGNLDVFARYLTNGGEAIPQFVFLNEQFVECGHWGPMPGVCKELIARGKACGDVATARTRVSGLYDADPGRKEVIRELLHFIDIAASAKI